MDFGMFETDQKLENEGVWRPCGDGKILIASTSSDRYTKVLQRLLKPHETAISLGAMDEAVSKEIYLQALAEGVILNWEGFTYSGDAVEYSKESALKMLKLAPRFRVFVETEARSIENFKAVKEQAEVKN